ncbi:hypothetical protein RFF05_16360 [Bengtsoniella intestinalis]|uniref:hypothetical protein n=1 Tax=Bengtsoniella intestinalis TaxID=3073143 RepID=UPI00391F5EA0
MTDFNCRFSPQAQKTTVVHIHSYENQNFEGVLQNGSQSEKKAFTNLTQMLFMIEAMQDSLAGPAKYMEPRTFTQSQTGQTPDTPPPKPLPKGTPLATFQIQLLFRQNASWQGNVIWVENKVEAQFRSVLELVTLMDSVLS